MKTKTTLLALAAILPLGLALAQPAPDGQNGPPPPPPPREGGGPGGDRPCPPHHPPGPPPEMRIIQAIDTDGDEIISVEELITASASLKKLDKNGDGQLTRDEYLLPPPPGLKDGLGKGPKSKGDRDHKDRPEPPAPPVLKALDTDGDGTISSSEIATSTASLKALDKNNDGQLGPGEYRPRPPVPPAGGGQPGDTDRPIPPDGESAQPTASPSAGN